MAKKSKTEIMKYEARDALTEMSSGALAAFEEFFSPELSAGARGGSGGSWVRLSAEGVMRQGEREIGSELDAVILAAVETRQLYPGAFIEGQKSSPVCFAIGTDAPHASSPQKQSAECATCRKGAFGSAPNGRGGRACRWERRLLLLPWGRDINIAEDPLYLMKVSPTNTTKLTSYNSKLESIGQRLQSVVTAISTKPHQKNRYEMCFEPTVAINDRERLEQLGRRAKAGRDMLMAPPSVQAEGDKQTSTGRRQVRA